MDVVGNVDYRHRSKQAINAHDNNKVYRAVVIYMYSYIRIRVFTGTYDAQ